LTLGQVRFELALNGNVVVVGQVTTAKPFRSESLILATVSYPCEEASLGIREGQIPFTKRSQL